jgi:thiamine biosynthesis lipoprotein
METVTLARNAMNTRFELVLHGAKPASLRAAAEEALTEVERIENQLSLFRPASEIARVNALAAREPVRVSPEVFALLAHAQRLSAETGGAFDITMAPLLRCWGLLGRSDGQVPTPEELAEARLVCGMTLVELSRANFTVRFARDGVMLDLGAIGKGYAVEKAAEILREAGVASALIHGGTSTVYATGTPPDTDAWKIAIEQPMSGQPLTPSLSPSDGERVAFRPGEGRSATPNSALAIIPLRNESLSVSAVSGKCFVADGRTRGHVIDPRTGEPASNALLAAVVLPSGTETDALSTALLVAGPDGHDAIASLRPGMRTLLASADGAGGVRCAGLGIEPISPRAV